MEPRKIEVLTNYNINDYIIPYFKFKELQCRECYKEGMGYFIRNENFLYRLGLFRKTLNLPFIVVSGVRCPFHNEKAGGHSQSGHLTGEAIDGFTPFLSVKELYLKLEHLSFFTGVGIYEEEERPFIHLDILPRIQRWTRKEGKYLYLFQK